MFKGSKRASFIACLFVLLTLRSYSQKVYDQWEIDKLLNDAYRYTLNFEFGKSRSLLTSYNGPSHFSKIYLEHLNDALELFITEDDSLFHNFEDAVEVRIDLLKNAEDSPYKWYYLSEIKLHKTFIHLKFGEEFAAAWNFRQAYIWAGRNRKQYPEFQLTWKNLGLMHVIIGSTPEKYRWLLGLFGFEGTVGQGIDEMQQATTGDPVFTMERDVMLAFVYSYLQQDTDKGLEILNQYKSLASRHLLIAYAYISLYLKSSQSENALDIIKAFEINENLLTPFFHYQKGNILQEMGDYDASTESFSQFLTEYEGHNYRKDASFKIGLNYWLSGQPEKANEYFKISVKSGQALTEADKYASYMLQEGLPDPNILKLRLATDGGFYDLAANLVESIRTTGTNSFKDSVEFNYRQARLLHKSGLPQDAIHFYKETLRRSGNNRWYFAPNSALQLGYIYREMGLPEESRKYFEKAMTYKNHPYKNSIDNKAEAGISGLDANK